MDKCIWTVIRTDVGTEDKVRERLCAPAAAITYSFARGQDRKAVAILANNSKTITKKR